MRRRPLPSTGSLGLVPPLQRYYETLRLPAAHFAAFVSSLGDTIVASVVLLPSVVGVPPGAWELSVPVFPIRIDDGNVGVSQVPWRLFLRFRGLQTGIRRNCFHSNCL